LPWTAPIQVSNPWGSSPEIFRATITVYTLEDVSWNLRIHAWRKIIFQSIIFKFELLIFRGCIFGCCFGWRFGSSKTAECSSFLDPVKELLWICGNRRDQTIKWEISEGFPEMILGNL